MGPKKKKSGGSKTSEKEEPLLVDGKNSTEMTKEQVEDYSKRLIEERDRANEERNFFQLERDQIATFWRITTQQLEELKQKLRSMECDMEEEEDLHQSEIKIYKQKVKHILYEQENRLVKIKAMAELAQKVLEDNHREYVNALNVDKEALRVQLKEQELAEQNHTKELHREKDKEVSKILQDYERRLKEHITVHSNNIEKVRKELALKRKTDIHEIEERKNTHIQALMKNHEKSFAQVKTYYNEITMNNIALIHNLKKEIEQIKKKEELQDVQIQDLTAENRKLVEPLTRAQGELQELRKELSNYEMDKLSLQRAKNVISLQKKEVKELKYEEEVHKQENDSLRMERDKLLSSFTKALSEIQQKSSMKNLLLEQKLDKLTDLLEIKDAQFNELLASSNLDDKSMAIVNEKISEVLTSKNNAIKDLRFEVARLAKAHNDLIMTCTAHLESSGIRKEDLGFEPLSPQNKKQQLGKGVAGLVSKPHLQR